MPELPEVETIRRGLDALIVGKTIHSAHNYDSPKSFPNALGDVSSFLVGANVVSVKRRAKLLLIELSSGYTLACHLKMTGQIIVVSDAARWGGGHPNDSFLRTLPDNTTREHIEFTDKTRLYFNDLRKFGWMKLYPTAEIPNIYFMRKVGPEPLEASFTAENFILRMRRRSGTSVKAALLDQTVLAGVGNIYADESLWGAKIHPGCKVAEVTDEKLAVLLNEVKRS